jgi:transposase
VDWTVSVDSTINRAHQHAAGARLAGAGAPSGPEGPARWAADQALGRSRGGLTTKVHVACDGRGLPLAIVITPGNVNDSMVFEAVMNALRVPRVGAGRPRRRPEAVIADKAYSSRAIRQALRGRAIRAVIPERSDRRPTACDADRSAAGRPPSTATFTKIATWSSAASPVSSKFGAIATRFDKLASRYEAAVQLASLVLWLRGSAQEPLSDRP